MSGPDATAGDVVRVYNRSDRAWVFGFVRLIPYVIVFCIVVAMFLGAFLQAVRVVPAEIVCPGFVVLLIGLLVMEYHPYFNPVNYVRLMDGIEVTRMVGRQRDYPAGQVVAVELSPHDTADYDDRERKHASYDAVIRIRGAFAVRLQVTAEGARFLTQWARRHSRPVREARVPGHEAG